MLKLLPCSVWQLEFSVGDTLTIEIGSRTNHYFDGWLDRQTSFWLIISKLIVTSDEQKLGLGGTAEAR
jgi:hypothetical protein